MSRGWLVARVQHWIVAGLFAGCVIAQAQTSPVAKPAPPPEPRTIDVVVTDSAGRPVTGLTRADFTLSEDNAPQGVRGFTPFANAPPVKLPALPPHTFSDDSPAMGDGVWNVLLVDALNTPMKDQRALRRELDEIVAHAPRGQRLAIFTLTDRLTMLAGFGDSLDALSKAMAHPLAVRPSTLRDGGEAAQRASAVWTPQMEQSSADLRAMESRVRERVVEIRVADTVDALDVLARFLAAYPGPKNVLWLTGSAAVPVAPLAGEKNVYGRAEDEPAAFRLMVDRMAQARVAISPIAVAALDGGAGASDADKHAMDAVATATGGHAFYAGGNAADVVEQAIAASTSGYALEYAPTNAAEDGALRNVHVELAGSAAARGLTLAYRRSYFAKKAQVPATKAADSSPDDDAAAAAREANVYTAAVGPRGGVRSAAIPFRADVHTASSATEDALAAGDMPDPSGRMKGPYRRLLVDFLTLPQAFQLTRNAEGRWTGTMKFNALVYDADGQLLNAAGRTVQLALTDTTRAEFLQKAAELKVEVSVPAQAETYLRLIVDDAAANEFGVVEIPTASLTQPAPRAAAAAAAPLAPR